jgi:hypothetical protein
MPRWQKGQASGSLTGTLTFGRNAAASRRAAPELCEEEPPKEIRRRRKRRVPSAPAARVHW